MTTLDANHAHRILAADLLDKAREMAVQGIHHGDRVPLGAVVDLTDEDWRLELLDLHRLGFIVLHRADLWWSWEERCGKAYMGRSTLTHLTSEWHAVELRREDAKALGLL